MPESITFTVSADGGNYAEIGEVIFNTLAENFSNQQVDDILYIIQQERIKKGGA